MLVRVEKTVINAVANEIKKIKDKEAIKRLEARIERIDGERLDILLQTKIFDEIYSKKKSTMVISVYELRVSKGKSSNLRALLCGIKKFGENLPDEIVLHVVKVWNKDTRKIPNKYIDIAIKRFCLINEDICK